MSSVRIVVEGIDGAGKDTFVEKLIEVLSDEGYTVRLVKTPVSPFKEIREVFDGAFSLERFLFYYVGGVYVERLLKRKSSTIYLKVKEGERDGEVAVFNRHFYSTFAYAFAYASSEEREVIEQTLANSSIKPEGLYVLLKPSLSELIKRLKERLKNQKGYYDKKLEEEFVKNRKKIEKLYEEFYIHLPKVLLPRIAGEYFILPNDTPEELEKNVNFVSNFAKLVIERSL